MDDDDRPVVLVVEDERRLADLFAGILREKFTVRVAYDGDEAAEEFDGAVDVALLDRRMPTVSGDEVLSRIRESDVDCAVAMVTAVNPSLDIVGMEFDDYVTKPVDPDELFSLVDRLLRRKQFDRDLRRHFRVASKIAVLEAEVSAGRLANSEEYDRLRAELDDLDRDLADVVEDMTPEDVGRLLSVSQAGE